MQDRRKQPIKLTKKVVDKLRVRNHEEDGDGAIDEFHFDAELARFGVRRKAAAGANVCSVSWMIQYRNREGRTRRFTFGDAAAMTPEEARRIAQSLIARIDDPKERYDPSAERKAARNAETFSDLADAYLESEDFKRKAPSTQAIDRGRIDHHLRPLLGNRALSEITRADMEAALRAIRDGKTATASVRASGKPRGRIRVKGGPGTARRVISLAGGMFTYAVKRGLITTNPCSHLDRGRDGTRETIVEDERAYAALFTALAELEGEGAITRPAADALRLIALTGARRGDIVNLRWRHVDLAHGRIVLGATEHKTGWRTGKPKVIGLPAVAATILAAIPAGEPEDFVIRSAKRGRPISLKKPWQQVLQRAGLPRTLTIHGLRHSIASHLAMSGASAPEIQAALGHASLATSVRYIHFAEARKNKLAERAAAVAVAGLHGSQGVAPAEAAAIGPAKAAGAS